MAVYRCLFTGLQCSAQQSFRFRTGFSPILNTSSQFRRQSQFYAIFFFWFDFWLTYGSILWTLTKPACIGPDQINPWNTISNLQSYSGIQGVDPIGSDSGFVYASTLSHVLDGKQKLCMLNQRKPKNHILIFKDLKVVTSSDLHTWAFYNLPYLK